MLLREADREAVRARWNELAGPVSATLTTRRQSPLVIPGRVECESCPTTEALVGELADLSENFRVEVRQVDDHPEGSLPGGRIPVIELAGEAKGRIRFVGLPVGHEFGSLVDAAIAVSGGPGSLSEAASATLESLTRPVHIQVFTTPT